MVPLRALRDAGITPAELGEKRGIKRLKGRKGKREGEKGREEEREMEILRDMREYRSGDEKVKGVGQD